MALEAGRVLDFGPRPRAIGAGEVANHHRYRLVLFAKLGCHARRYVAIHARDTGVGRGDPRLVVRLHDVTGTAKGRRRAHFHGPVAENDSQPDQ